MRIKVVVLARNCEGAPEFFTTDVSVTQDEYDDGVAYEAAKAEAEAAGHEPKFAFDANDPAAKQLHEVSAWMHKKTELS